MKSVLKDLDFQPRFIIDKAGKKTAIILDIETYEKIKDELETFYKIISGKLELSERS